VKKRHCSCQTEQAKEDGQTGRTALCWLLCIESKSSVKYCQRSHRRIGAILYYKQINFVG
jgi:hypothetical protein